MQKTKQAKQTEKQGLTVQTVLVNDSNTASFLVPKYIMTDQKLAVVDEGVLERLKMLLKSADIADILSLFEAKMQGVFSLETWVALLSNELAFHKTVNLLDDYFDNEVIKVIEKPFNVVESLTLDEMKVKQEMLRREVELLELQIIKHPDFNKGKEQNIAEVVSK